MVFPVNTDIIALVKGTVESMVPYALAHRVTLRFGTNLSRKQAYYKPEEIINALARLMSEIIAITSPNHTIEVGIHNVDQTEEFLHILIRNTGVNLTRMGNIGASLKYSVQIKVLDKDALIQIKIPIQPSDYRTLTRIEAPENHSLIKPWYSEIRKRLTSHFRNPQNIEASARQRSQLKGIFLKKINAIIYHNIDQEGFSAEELAKRVALSRTQLHRKLKELTQMAPAQYIRFVRLQKAKELLENSGLNVSEVAYRVGFISNSHFSRAFHRQFGINPSVLKSE
ncbi:MAG: helix-turn-helix transcriptional regulator [Saprospiraceae bacterium]|nr:helix-turn-helix transcriptional regulator [Saprospiraceae bacterium]